VNLLRPVSSKTRDIIPGELTGLGIAKHGRISACNEPRVRRFRPIQFEASLTETIALVLKGLARFRG
jgi:hypothetical protein